MKLGSRESVVALVTSMIEEFIQMLQSLTGTLPWVTGYSKMMPLSRLQDFWYLGA